MSLIIYKIYFGGFCGYMFISTCIDWMVQTYPVHTKLFSHTAGQLPKQPALPQWDDSISKWLPTLMFRTCSVKTRSSFLSQIFSDYSLPAPSTVRTCQNELKHQKRWVKMYRLIERMYSTGPNHRSQSQCCICRGSMKFFDFTTGTGTGISRKTDVNYLQRNKIRWL